MVGLGSGVLIMENAPSFDYLTEQGAFMMIRRLLGPRMWIAHYLYKFFQDVLPHFLDFEETLKTVI